MELFMIFFGAIFFNNFVLNRFLGICPFLGVSKRIETSVGMGMAVAFVMTLASVMTWLLQGLLLNPLGLGYLQTIVFILVIAALVQFVEMFMQKVSPTLHKALGVYLPLITTNCAILGIAILNIDYKYNLVETIVHSLGAAIGFTLALVMLAGIREKLEINDVPDAFAGVPIALITAGILALAFSGFVL
ncbi:MAG: electron transport complex subunit RsxA [Firmicutes bacterium]|nr:electron transport complex subunit RsxA [Bacillota bacterium]HOB35569.1 electron transport complex subunit RsxA [Bacillota bacterium]HPZ91431.1 electron transport complex subunit RsxA [Bacillota bacterium]HQE02183.1 electron transport complex subunit RsxA [Bacillota bacterium]